MIAQVFFALLIESFDLWPAPLLAGFFAVARHKLCTQLKLAASMLTSSWDVKQGCRQIKQTCYTVLSACLWRTHKTASARGVRGQRNWAKWRNVCRQQTEVNGPFYGCKGRWEWHVRDGNGGVQWTFRQKWDAGRRSINGRESIVRFSPRGNKVHLSLDSRWINRRQCAWRCVSQSIFLTTKFLVKSRFFVANSWRFKCIEISRTIVTVASFQAVVMPAITINSKRFFRWRITCQTDSQYN